MYQGYHEAEMGTICRACYAWRRKKKGRTLTRNTAMQFKSNFILHMLAAAFASLLQNL